MAHFNPTKPEWLAYIQNRKRIANNSINQSIGQSQNREMNQWIDQSINRPTEESINISINQSTIYPWNNSSIYRRIDPSITHRSIHRSIAGLIVKMNKNLFECFSESVEIHLFVSEKTAWELENTEANVTLIRLQSDARRERSRRAGRLLVLFRVNLSHV